MIKKFLLASVALAAAAGAASAADLPSRCVPSVYVPPPLAVPYSWTGVEFGLTTSYSFRGSKSVTTTPFGGTSGQPGYTSLSKSGLDEVGGGVAYNYQFTPGSGVVVGGAADVNFLNLRKNVSSQIPAGFGGNFQERVAYLGTVNGRIGYGFDHFLVYGLGGFAYGDVHNSAFLYSPGFTSPFFGNGSSIRTGYDYGGGFEYAIPADSFLNYLSVEKLVGKFMGGTKIGFLSFLDSSESTLRAEFVHYSLGSNTVIATNVTGAPGGYVNRFKTEGNLVRFGLGYKIGGLSAAAPVVARY